MLVVRCWFSILLVAEVHVGWSFDVLGSEGDMDSKVLVVDQVGMPWERGSDISEVYFSKDEKQGNCC